MSLPSSYKIAAAENPGSPLALKDTPMPTVGDEQVLVKVLACSVCHTDAVVAAGYFGISFPRVPGHEIIGDVVKVGSAVVGVKPGDRVGGSWHGVESTECSPYSFTNSNFSGHDGTCRECSRGLVQMCQNEEAHGVTLDGGFGEYVLMRSQAVVGVPADMDPAEAAPLMCAGLTSFNGIRKMGIEAGGLVAVQGLGGLGHLAIQYANRMGYKVVALSSGSSKKEFAAHHYVDTSAEDPVKALIALGGADLIVATAPHAKAVSPLINGLRSLGNLLVLAPVGNVEFDTTVLLRKGASVLSWPSGNITDAEEILEFSKVHGVKCLVEKFPLGKVNEAMGHMLTGSVRFRSVLVVY